MNKSIQKVNILNGAHRTNAPIKTNGNQNNGAYITVKQPSNGTSNSGVQWTVKSLMDPNNSRGFSNINSWLSPKKLVDGKPTQSSFPSNGITQNHTPGFDMTKLYPELSSKLGLTKAHTEAVSQSNCFKTKGHAPVQFSFVSSNDAPVKVAIKRPLKNSVVPSKSSSKTIPVVLNTGPVKPVVNSRNKVNGVRISQSRKPEVIEPHKSLPIKTVKQEHPSSEHLSDVSMKCLNTKPVVDKPQRSVVHIYPKKLLSFPKDETSSDCQLRVRSAYEKQYAYFSDLFPLGFNSSDEDTLENASSNLLPCQRFSERKDSFSGPSNCMSPDEALSDIKQQVCSARERLKYKKSDNCDLSSITKALIDAARENPALAASTVSYFTKKSPHLQSKKRKSSFQTTLLEIRSCAYELDGAVCGLDALPGTRHCLKHITYNVDQQLFSQCSAKLEDNSFCRVPTFDVYHEPPLCSRHTDYVHTVAQPPSTIEPKKARKKNKMPIVSRYGKRNKKRRRSSVSSTTIVPSTCVRPSINSPGVCLGSPQAASPFTPRTSPTFPTGKTGDSDSDQELVVMDSSLSLDDTRLLDRDLQEVFNKFPASELSNFFNGPETKESTSDGEFDENKIDSPHPVPDKEFSSSDSGIGTTDPSLETQNSSNLPLSLDSHVLGELATNGSIDSIISSSFNQQELNTISQVLSNIVHEDGLNLASFPLGGQPFDGELLKNDLTVLDNQHANMCYDNQTALVDGLKNQNDSLVEPLNSVDCKLSLVRQANKLQIDAPTLPPLQ